MSASRTICAMATLLLATQVAATSTATAGETWTAVTVGRSSFGAASSPSLSVAIAEAIHDCRSRAAAVSDCGAEIKTIKAGHVLAVRCGDYHALVTGDTREEAESALQHRLLQLRYVSNAALGPCVTAVDIPVPSSADIP